MNGRRVEWVRNRLGFMGAVVFMSAAGDAYDGREWLWLVLASVAGVVCICAIQFSDEVPS